MRDVPFLVHMSEQMRDDFNAAGKASGQPVDQIVRELIRGYLDQTRVAEITPAERRWVLGGCQRQVQRWCRKTGGRRDALA